MAQNPRLTYGSKLYIKGLETVGSRYQHSAVDDQNVRTCYSNLSGPLGANLRKKEKKRKKRLLSIASASRKHTDGERVEQEPFASGFSMSCHAQALI